MEIPFDGILTLLIFLVGIPALILQLISATERNAVLKKGRLDVSYFLTRAFLVIGIGIFIQLLFVYLFGRGDSSLLQKSFEQILWLLIFIPLVIYAVQVSRQIPEQYGRREKIVEKLTQDVLVETEKKGRVAGGTFVDLANLGEHCDAGKEREMVVKAFAQIAKRMLASSRYKGESFETLIDDLVHMLASNPEAKDLDNYKTAVEILSTILSVNHSVDTDDDKRRAVHAISHLGRTLLINFESVERNNVILSYVDSLEFALVKPSMLTEVSQALFEIGVCAAQAGHDLVAVAALDKLTTLAGSKPPPLPVEFVSDMFGLLVHYWATDGSRKAYAKRKFDEMKQFLGRNKIQALKSAQLNLVTTMYFEEADKLTEMIEYLKREEARKKSARKRAK